MVTVPAYKVWYNYNGWENLLKDNKYDLISQYFNSLNKNFNLETMFTIHMLCYGTIL